MSGPFTALRNKLPKRTPKQRMVNLLEQQDQCGYIAVEYPRQWPTLLKAERLGYIIEGNIAWNLTDKGRIWLEANTD